MKHNGFKILFLTGMAFISCDTTELLELPVPSPKLVVNTVGGTSKPFYASVSLSQPILDDFKMIPVSNAVLDLYENDKFVETLTFSRIDSFWNLGGWYQSNGFYPTSGNRYRLEVTAPNYQPVVATYHHPYPVAPQSLEVKLSGKPATKENPFNAVFRVGLIDPPGENFYQIHIVGKSEDVLFPPWSMLFGLSFADPAFEENNLQYVPSLFDDRYFDGKSTVLEFNTVHSQDDPHLTYYDVYLTALSKEFYWYLRTSGMQAENFFDPLAQPVKVENNIGNGIGIFGGYAETKKTFYIPH